jgi:SpoVK/Ycf46/Vps4 family AAA+-type ATPase
MARADLLETIVRAGASGDQALFRRAVEAVIAEERAKQHHIVADRLAEELSKPGRAPTLRVVQTALPATEGARYVHEARPERTLDDMVLPPLVEEICRELLEEQERSDLLRSHGLEPRHRVLLTGAPGNGKTSLADAIANHLGVPLLTVRYDQLIGSYLGETTQRLGKLFEHVRGQRCVLFFDEFDAVGKERADPHETGEIKRVVSTLLLEVDSLPSHVIVIAASNHPDLLDKAVWRRFQVRVELPPPTHVAIVAWLARTLVDLPVPGSTWDDAATKLVDSSYAEVAEFTADVRRRLVLAGPDASAKGVIAARLRQWTERHRVSGTKRRGR